MSFNRIRDDPETYKREVKASLKQGDYLLEPPSNHDDNSFCMPYAARGSRIMTPISQFIDDESELRGQTRPLSKDPAKQMPRKLEYYNSPRHSGKLKDCSIDPFVDAEYTQLIPSRNRQDINLVRMDSKTLFENPQEMKKISSNTRNGLNTRLYYRDTFKKK